ncbi:MAG TPA: DUF4118 domain-containing protein, partial [Tepidisphaeraceae bacterium]|nr:DUF4118 domain-containing protein [Tepidisphaeraceae bacterium]
MSSVGLRHGLVRYGWASVVAIGTAILVGLTAPYLEQHMPIFLFVLAVMAAGYLGGIGPGMLAVGMNVAAGFQLSRPSLFSIDPAHSGRIVHLVMFVTAGTLVSVICGAMHRSRQRTRMVVNDLAQSNRRIGDILATITECVMTLDR